MPIKATTEQLLHDAMERVNEAIAEQINATNDT
jgi:hypothetical protein